MIRRQGQALVLAAALICASMTACAHGRPQIAAADEVPPTEQPADARTRLYADCAGAAVQAGTVTRFGHYVRFTCVGAPAQAFYDAVETYARLRAQEVTTGQRTTRHIASAPWDDQCWSDRDPATGERTYGCFTDQPAAAGFISGKDAPDRMK